MFIRSPFIVKRLAATEATPNAPIEDCLTAATFDPFNCDDSGRFLLFRAFAYLLTSQHV